MEVKVYLGCGCEDYVNFDESAPVHVGHYWWCSTCGDTEVMEVEPKLISIDTDGGAYYDTSSGVKLIAFYPKGRGNEYGLYAPALDEWMEETFSSLEEGLEGATMLWPSNSVWAGQPTPDGRGWLIDID